MNIVEQKASKETDKLKKIDFKMVSFTLSGKDYGINILKVKEIRKAGNFTHVPNTPVYVRGVDNLRGDIIPIIDLRIMFNLPAETKEAGGLENIIILRMDELVLGIIVDNIEKVVGISKETIQPPHPIFGDINVKYISGVVENEDRLYIILDVDRIFGYVPPVEERQQIAEVKTLPPMEENPATDKRPSNESVESLDLQFIKETLGTFSGFYATALNQDWLKFHAVEWKTQRQAQGLDFQLTNSEDALEFLKVFPSPYTGRLWDPSDLSILFEHLDFEGTQITVWNPGCAQGYESFSLAVGFLMKYEEKNIKVWANDKDLLSISMAPSLSFPSVPEEYKPFMVETKTGYQFKTELKSKILFEYHDITHMNPFSDLHMIVARDTISFLKPQDQEKIIADFYEKLRVGGYLILGQNEKLSNSAEWKTVEWDDWSIYQKI
ncbi:MAG: hypothetical protein A2Z96_06835 [Spirochaetes bacterium GWB1_48_6]|nr:MAG: hypothetical protein A2Z96_06835 [Spirochaetes bacterium GWB1_48_6]